MSGSVAMSMQSETIHFQTSNFYSVFDISYIFRNHFFSIADTQDTIDRFELNFEYAWLLLLFV